MLITIRTLLVVGGRDDWLFSPVDFAGEGSGESSRIGSPDGRADEGDGWGFLVLPSW